MISNLPKSVRIGPSDIVFVGPVLDCLHRCCRSRCLVNAPEKMNYVPVLSNVLQLLLKWSKVMYLSEL